MAALFVAAKTPISGFASDAAASVTAPAENVLNPSAVGAFSVAAMTIAASVAVVAIRIAAFVTAPPMIDALHSVGGDRWRGLLTFL